MKDIENRAKNQAARHAEKFFDENEWSDILEKYAEVSNKAKDEHTKIIERNERGAKLESSDFTDYFYYDAYRSLFAIWIANSELYRNEYEQNNDNNWILKKEAFPQKSIFRRRNSK